METTLEQANLQPFSDLFRQSLGLTYHKFIKLIITWILASFLAIVIFGMALLPLGFFTAFVIDANSKADLTASLTLLAIAFAIAIGGFFYQLAFRFKSALLVISNNNNTFDAIGASFLKSFGITLTNICSFTVIFGGVLLSAIVSVLLISISKYFALVTGPVLFALMALSFLIFLVPYVSVLENKTGLSPFFEVFKLTKGKIFATIGRILLFYFTLTVIALFGVYILGDPLNFIGSFFSRGSFINDLLTVYLPEVVTVLFAFAVPLLNIAFLFNLYSDLRRVNPINQEKVALKIRIPLITASTVGFLHIYVFVLGLTTLSFFILKPRAIWNKIQSNEKVERMLKR